MTVPKPLMDASSSTDELLRSVLASSSADDPSLEAVARVSGKLASALPAGALAVGVAGAGVAGAGATAAVVSVKWLAVAALGGALVGAGVYAAAVPRAPIAPASSTAPSATNAPATRAPLVESAAPAPAAASTSTSSATTTPSAARALPSTTPAPSPLAPSSSAGVAAPSETQLLDRAHDALLHGDPTAALALTSEHARLYRTGVLVQEREMIAIEALLALGRKPEATRRADAFRAAYPTSSHLTRLNALLGAP